MKGFLCQHIARDHPQTLPSKARESVFPVALREREGVTCPGNPVAHSTFYSLATCPFRCSIRNILQASCADIYFMCPPPAPRRNAHSCRAGAHCF